MYRQILGTVFVAFLLSACTPAETPVPLVEYSFTHSFVSDGTLHRVTIADQDVSIEIMSEGGTDTEGVVVTIHDFRNGYMIETADPRANFLPAIQFEPKLDVPLHEFSVQLASVDYDPNIQVLGGEIPADFRGEFLGATSLDNLRSFLSQWILGNSVNLLFDDPPSYLLLWDVEIYRTPGTLSFIIAVPETIQSKWLSDQSAFVGQDKNAITISLRTATFESVATTTLVENAQTVLDQFLIAQTDGQPGVPVTGSDIEDISTLECAENEELVTVEQNGTTVTECQAIPLTEIAPTPTEATPEVDTATFPAVDPLILGNCSESVHNRYAVEGPDGNEYRTWHPIVVDVDTSAGGGQVCSFAHEHGDPPHPDALSPYFGYAAYHADELDVVKDHEGYKVFTHIRGQLTGWGTREGESVNPDIDMQFWAHQGSSRNSRLSHRFHDVGFWSIDSLGNVTEVYYLADTGELNRNCPGEGLGGRIVASSCDYSKEIWGFGGTVGEAWGSEVQVAVTNPMNFMLGDPDDLQSIQLISTSEEICANAAEPCDTLHPFGHPDTIWDRCQLALVK
jgi:hypothetical protein